MASKDMVGLRMSDEEIARLDAEARKRGMKRAALIRCCIDWALVDPYKITEDASRGQFSVAQVKYILSIDDETRGLPVGPVRQVMNILRHWLTENPFHPDAEIRVKAAMSSVGQAIRSRMQEDLKLLEELENSDDLKNLLNTMLQEHAATVEEDDYSE